MGSVPKKKVCRYTQPVRTAPRLIFFPLHFWAQHTVWIPSNLLMRGGWGGIFKQSLCNLDLKRQFAALLPHFFPFHPCTVMHLAWSSLFSHSLVVLPGSSANRAGAWSVSKPMPRLRFCIMSVCWPFFLRTTEASAALLSQGINNGNHRLFCSLKPIYLTWLSKTCT